MKQHVFWTIAPNGFANRRGQSQRGPKLGDGPLPSTATSRLRDPRIDASLATYAWDIHGRRHLKGDNRDAESAVELAMSAIRKAASNATLYKLDLRAVFDQIDVSGDGKITIDEMARAFELMGVQVSDDVLLVLFHHFDPNGSGAVQYGEFMWAFFNRRSLVRQWKLSTKGMTSKQIELKFRQCDTSGNGKLNYREFQKVLASFQIKLSDSDTELLMNRFDSDGDGSLNLFEFTRFIQEEIEARNRGAEDSIAQKAAAAPPSPTDLAALFSKQKDIEQKLAQLNIALGDKAES
jgi:Ca2+-binding EF-hand superfamily protein